LILTACATGPRPAAGRSGTARELRTLVLHCLPAPTSRALPDTESVVVTTLDLYLGTGRWAGEDVRVTSKERPREGTDEECQALLSVAAGRPPASFLDHREPLLVAGILRLEHRRQADRTRIEVGLAVLEVAPGGAVRWAAPVEVATDHSAIVSGAEVERNQHEVARELTERVARQLRQR
jgi:hypothetical protein